MVKETAVELGPSRLPVQQVLCLFVSSRLINPYLLVHYAHALTRACIPDSKGCKGAYDPHAPGRGPILHFGENLALRGGMRRSPYMHD